MTACARGTSSFKDPTGVAAVTADILMSTIEVEAGAEMIELLLCVRRGGKQQNAEKYGN